MKISWRPPEAVWDTRQLQVPPRSHAWRQRVSWRKMHGSAACMPPQSPSSFLPYFNSHTQTFVSPIWGKGIL